MSAAPVLQLARADPAKTDTIQTGFLTDNLRWSPDERTIYAGGQPPLELAASFGLSRPI